MGATSDDLKCRGNREIWNNPKTANPHFCPSSLFAVSWSFDKWDTTAEFPPLLALVRPCERLQVLRRNGFAIPFGNNAPNRETHAGQLTQLVCPRQISTHRLCIRHW